MNRVKLINNRMFVNGTEIECITNIVINKKATELTDVNVNFIAENIEYSDINNKSSELEKFESVIYSSKTNSKANEVLNFLSQYNTDEIFSILHIAIDSL